MIIEPGPAFDDLFRSFEHTAFRLETRDLYRSADEEVALKQFTIGSPVDMTWYQEWLKLITDSTAAGLRFTRVRVVSLPLTDYSRFGLYCSEFSNRAGEVTRYLERSQAIDVPDYDYWLFDSTTLVRMHFDHDENFLGGELIEDAHEVVKHNYYRDAAWHIARGRSEFASTTGTQQRVGSPRRP